MLLAAVVGSGIMAERLAAGNIALALLANSLATGAALIAIILALESISGPHLNPVVTLADSLMGGLPWKEAPLYIVVQCAGAIAGVAATHIMFGLPLLTASTHARSGPAQVFSEFVATFGLLAVIWGCVRTTPRRNALCRRRLHHRCLLVHQFHLLCQSSRHARALSHRHLRRHPPNRRTSLHGRSTRRSHRSNTSLSLVDTTSRLSHSPREERAAGIIPTAAQ